MTEPNENFRPSLRLIFQGSILIQDNEEGEKLYKQLKTYIKDCSNNVTFNGQINKSLEPCCGKKTTQ